MIYIDNPTRDALGFVRLTGEVTHGYSTYQWTYAAGELRVPEDSLSVAQLKQLYDAIGAFIEETV
jgi:hypothetical protein